MSSTRKADLEWDSHKAIIETLYVKNKFKLEGPGGLRDFMATIHGFDKSKSQYETYFKKWGMRKYRKKDDWKVIGRKVAERKRAGKDSEVYINNEVIPNARVQKQIRRHNFAAAFDQNIPAPSPQTPEDFDIRTPVAEEDNAAFSQLQDAASPLSPWMRMNNLEFSQIQNTSPPMLPGMRSDDLPLPQFQNAPSSLPPGTGMDDISLYQLQNTPPSCQYFMVPDKFLFSQTEDAMHLFQPRMRTFDLPFSQLEEYLYAQVNVPLIPTNTRHRSEASLNTPLLLEDHQDISHQFFDVHHEMPQGPESLTAVLKALLPSTARVSQVEDQLIPSPSNHHSGSDSPRLFILLLFAMANNFAGLNRVPMKEIMEYLKRQTNTRLLQHVLSNSGPELEAFAEKLFVAAIESEDARIVDALLQKGLNPNDLVCWDGNGWECTPVEYSSTLQNIEITRLLLRAKADVNKTYRPHSRTGGAVQCAIRRRRGEQSRQCLELVHMLLDAGGDFTEEIFENAICTRDQDLCHFLIEFWAKTKPFDLVCSRIPELLATSFDNETASRMFVSILKTCADSDRRASPTFQKDLACTLDLAAERGNLELVQFLLGSGVSLTEKTLVRAITNKNRELVEFLLDAGADVDSAVVQGFDLNYGQITYHSPLAEAIRWGDIEIMNLLEDKGVWSRIGEKRRFQAALLAASEVGELTIVQKLLNLRQPNTMEEELGTALVAATLANQDVIALTLLDACTDVNGVCYDSYVNVCRALQGALRQQNATLVRSLLDADLDIDVSVETFLAAVEWGDHSIIEKLLAMGADVNAYERESGETPLMISIKKKDTKSMQLLLNAGVDVNNPMSRLHERTALRAAVTNGDLELVEHLLFIGADPDDSGALNQAMSQGMLMIEKLLTAYTRRYPYRKKGYGSYAFLKAIQEGDLILVELLLQAGIHANTGFLVQAGSSDRATALGAAIKEEHSTSLAILQRLLNANDNPNIIVRGDNFTSVRDRKTALLAAIDTRDIQKVQLLIDAGADVNWPATRGVNRTPLQLAAEIGSFELAQILIDKGGQVNAPPAVWGGATALQLAAIGGYVSIAELLLDNNTDVNAPPAKFDGRTALEGAAEYGRIDMLKLLSNAGAKFHGSEYKRARKFAKKNGHMVTWRYLESLAAESEG